MHNQLQLLDYSWVGRIPALEILPIKPDTTVRFYYGSFVCKILFELYINEL
ncbi:hypothetical protein SAMN05192573_104222 [Mucilaginibacter gossypii]|uniref:Uncharacterized protein n=1 Tax=Mucilaginibacter gossypii TaxID=551996 RepID=A0A1G7VXB8_9SPHI|nr:hypothetical protein SAMN05192573_104222 [Mucilaginibacter gossypii]